MRFLCSVNELLNIIYSNFSYFENKMYPLVPSISSVNKVKLFLKISDLYEICQTFYWAE